MTDSAGNSTGSCLCGGITYRISGPVGPIENCHCQMCRKAHGAAFSTNGVVASADVELTSGTELITTYASSPQRLKCFCSRCGSPLFIRRLNDETNIVITLGTLDSYAGSGASRHVFVDAKAGWHHITDDLPQYR